jgi:hypothetical protein
MITVILETVILKNITDDLVKAAFDYHIREFIRIGKFTQAANKNIVYIEPVVLYPYRTGLYILLKSLEFLKQRMRNLEIEGEEKISQRLLRIRNDAVSIVFKADADILFYHEHLVAINNAPALAGNSVGYLKTRLDMLGDNGVFFALNVPELIEAYRTVVFSLLEKPIIKLVYAMGYNRKLIHDFIFKHNAYELSRKIMQKMRIHKK